mmetsp:Transcript_5327/g.12731  ORF Transcript_5327/g.12731 Transcript_5327/m.12731 type:complete len:281 (+) Transcript_5327:443-1285(+)
MATTTSSSGSSTGNFCASRPTPIGALVGLEARRRKSSWTFAIPTRPISSGTSTTTRISKLRTPTGPTIAGTPSRDLPRAPSSRLGPARRPTATSASIMAPTPRSQSSPTAIGASRPPRRRPATSSSCRAAMATCSVCGGSIPALISYICGRILVAVPPSPPHRAATSSIYELATTGTASRGGSTIATANCSRAIVTSVSSGTLRILERRYGPTPATVVRTRSGVSSTRVESALTTCVIRSEAIPIGVSVLVRRPSARNWSSMIATTTTTSAFGPSTKTNS